MPTDKYGFFSETAYLAIGDPYLKRGQISDREKGLNFKATHVKSGNRATFNKFIPQVREGSPQLLRPPPRRAWRYEHPPYPYPIKTLVPLCVAQHAFLPPRSMWARSTARRSRRRRRR